MEPDKARSPTGIEGLDALLDGGLPTGSVSLLRGGPGAGKTTLSLQFLFEGVKRGEKGLYVSLEEKPDEIIRNASQYGWDFEKAISSGMLSIRTLRLTRVKDYLKADDSQQNWLVSMEGGNDSSGITGDFRADAVGNILARLIKETGARRLVFDSLTMFTAQFEHKVDLHMETLGLIQAIMREGCTTILTAHQDPAGAHVVSAEEYLPQGVINLYFLQQSNKFLQAIQVVKMRGVRHDRELRPYRITDAGIIVYNNEAVLGGL
jgi:KaiC/GvpD/RAD55 family RecA-like ATPase